MHLTINNSQQFPLSRSKSWNRALIRNSINCKYHIKFEWPTQAQMSTKGLLLEGSAFDLNLELAQAQSITLTIVLMDNSGIFDDTAKTVQLKESQRILIRNLKPTQEIWVYYQPQIYKVGSIEIRGWVDARAREEGEGEAEDAGEATDAAG